jgi:hypothetical protein
MRFPIEPDTSTNTGRVLAFIRSQRHRGATTKEISQTLGIDPDEIYSLCRKLQKQAFIDRRKRIQKPHNFILWAAPTDSHIPPHFPARLQLSAQNFPGSLPKS